MRHTVILYLALSTALLQPGCGTKPSSTPDHDSKVSNAKEKIKDAVDATAEAAKAKRDEYALEMSKRLDESNAKYE